MHSKILMILCLYEHDKARIASYLCKITIYTYYVLYMHSLNLSFILKCWLSKDQNKYGPYLFNLHVFCICIRRFGYSEQLSSLPVFSGVRVTRSLVLCVCFVDSCLSFCTFSFGHCVVYSFRYTDSDCPFGIFKLFFQCTSYVRIGETEKCFV